MSYGLVWKRRLRAMRAYKRAWLGLCPACNSDAPAIDTCQVCHSYRGEHPPHPCITAGWLMLYFDDIGDRCLNDYRVTVGGHYLRELIERAGLSPYRGSR
jgi:hypothetical protein